MRTTRFALPVAIVAALQMCGCGASWSPSRPTGAQGSTPLSATLGWFRAINDKNLHGVISYFVPSQRARNKLGGGWSSWPVSEWSTFTKLRCRMLPNGPGQSDINAAGRLVPATPSLASVQCDFDESASLSEGNPNSFWDIALERVAGRWLILGYGQP